MKSRLPSKLFALRKLAKAVNSASFNSGLCSDAQIYVKLRAPSLAANFCTSPLFWTAAAKIEHANFRILLSVWDTIRLRTSAMPPERQRFKLLRGCSSTSSCSSSSLAASSVTGIALLSLSSWQIYWSRSVSLNVYALSASCSQILSSWDISLNSEGCVPSWYCIDHLNNPCQSTIVIAILFMIMSKF